MVQLSYLYTTTGKTIAVAIWTFVSKMMSDWMTSKIFSGSSFLRTYDTIGLSSIGRTDAEAEASILWPSDGKS